MNQSQNKQVLSVSQLNRKAKQLLETHLPLIWLEGEISNLAKPSSGHWYLTLKDQGAQVRGAMFRNRNQTLRFSPQNGDKVIVRARVSLYEGRGDYQLIVEHMQPAGAGDLQAQFEALKEKLFKQGLMAAERKRALPSHIGKIALITSPSGAAVRDVLSVLKRRSPSTEVTILPCQVQGDMAASQIISAIELANRHQCADAILLTRGGGSLEDLWAFNNEALAYAITNSDIPVISAVGHEVDFTIADFVADLRAATPSAAAELLSQDQENQQQLLLGNAVLLGQACQRKIATEKLKLEQLSRRLRHPGQILEQQSQRLDNLEIRLQQSWSNRLALQQQRLAGVQLRFEQQHPKQQLEELQQTVNKQSKNLSQLINNRLQKLHMSLSAPAGKLQALSPLAVLQRGFSISRDSKGKIIHKTAQTNTGDLISVQLGDGKLDCQVAAIHTSK
ncbi:exodeoxyribonuclease VII large subunit [uncultured Pseudoteredinibacter sp.]|uniref:exodeoxyribonuclease VII large subunit n=1 Tax=uncultured Pseudoteredinibacter sp. TaxID=1641701 RepID=UPI00261CE05C|nr:exodeoxyribonuclease VII large subunit [uncultured Pseudoteredinibacter sp.]